MNFIRTFLFRVSIIRLRKKIARAKSDYAHEEMRMRLEFLKKEQKIQRLAEDNKLALKRARDDWAVEQDFISEHIENLEARLHSEIVQLDHINAPLQLVVKKNAA